MSYTASYRNYQTGSGALAGHCIRHPELLANDLVTWNLKQGEGRPKGAELPVNDTKGCWDKHSGTANPDAISDIL